jgi:uncharacterized membrane protein YqhA
MKTVLKIAITIIVVFIFLNSFVFVGLGVYKSIHAYTLIAQQRMEERPGIYMAEALDSFLIALVFIVFSIGVTKLFLPDTIPVKGFELAWLKFESFTALKLILWEMLLTTLFVFFATDMVVKSQHLEWNLLIIPGSILMLALAYKFIKQGH